MGSNSHLLEIENLRTYFFVRGHVAKAVDEVDLAIAPGKTLGLVGESGCGKSVTAHSIIGLIPDPPGKIVDGSILFEGTNLLELPEAKMRKIRGNQISMIFQEPMTSLNPVYSVGDQVAEVIKLHQNLSRRETRDRVIEMFQLVGISAAATRLSEYPHQMSGGMRQRIAGAIALACDAKVIIADEPTTNLDVTTQQQYLMLLKEIQKESGVGVVFITHDFGIVSSLCDRVAVMYAGKIVETGRAKELMAHPAHPYTRALLDSLPKPGAKVDHLHTIKGEPPNPVDLPPGCAFAPRCSKATKECLEEYPQQQEISPNRLVSCFHAG